MLGRIHGSVEHLYVPRLLPLTVEGQVSKFNGEKPKSHTLFTLDWESVDSFKRKQYSDWIAGYWEHEFPNDLEGKFPATLPPRYDAIIKNLHFALPQKYHAEINHFTTLYYIERHRIRNFDTMIREMCLKVSESAINCAFRLLSDCVYDVVSKTWFREDGEVDKHLIQCLMRYKFWRGATGDGLVWDHAGFDNLECSVVWRATHIDKKLAMMYRRCLGEIRTWEEEQNKFRSFVSVEMKMATNEGGQEPISEPSA